jgi:hypothetical protein
MRQEAIAGTIEGVRIEARCGHGAEETMAERAERKLDGHQVRAMRRN